MLGLEVGVLGLEAGVVAEVEGDAPVEGFAVDQDRPTTSGGRGSIVRVFPGESHAGTPIPDHRTTVQLPRPRDEPEPTRPDRSAILLVAGDKSDQWNRWYLTVIGEAERLHAEVSRRTQEEEGDRT